MAAYKRVKGVRAFSTMIDRLPDAMRTAMVRYVLEPSAAELLAAMRSDAPKRRGRLAAGLSSQVSRQPMRMQVGLIGRKANREFFYGWILEYGRKGKTVTVRRRRAGAPRRLEGGRKPAADVITYRLRVKAMPARQFVDRPREELRERIGKRLDDFWDNALAQAGRGLGNE